MIAVARESRTGPKWDRFDIHIADTSHRLEISNLFHFLSPTPHADGNRPSSMSDVRSAIAAGLLIARTAIVARPTGV